MTPILEGKVNRPNLWDPLHTVTYALDEDANLKPVLFVSGLEAPARKPKMWEMEAKGSTW